MKYLRGVTHLINIKTLPIPEVKKFTLNLLWVLWLCKIPIMSVKSLQEIQHPVILGGAPCKYLVCKKEADGFWNRRGERGIEGRRET